MVKHRAKRTPPVYTIDAEREDIGFIVLRNERPLMTPAGEVYALPTKALAEALAQEWRAQGETLVPASMPLTQLAATAFDLTAKACEKTILELLSYAQSDLLCHQVEEPRSLAEKQKRLWQPCLRWAEERMGVCFVIAQGVMPVRQAPQTIDRLRAALLLYDPFRLTGLSCATANAGSLILGLMLSEGAALAQEVFEASILDATHQAERWGLDPVTQARHAAIRDELASCARWFALLSGDPPDSC